MSVIARIEPLVIPTYPVGEPEKNPVFFENRVYQGSNGKVYPVPFIDKVYDEPVDVTYQSVLLENDYVSLVLLPEIGGRIYTGVDKTNNNYDFFYRNEVIKPALVGLAGPWISGGVEFNWPQHHRPGTFLPADVEIEEEEDGSRTVWMSEHDPLNRLKGMHGIRLRPDSSVIELRARLYNRTPNVHTFLWWANVAAEVHDDYQSFFPQDVNYVADHAVRATSSFPVANNPYYGIDYQDRPGSNDLGWYKNIPVPTSYMVCQTNFDFFGGYDFRAKGGFVHVANRHIAPGKKQWTWGDDKFGHAWDKELTDTGGPYIELMAGVYTDNQPDFTYLHPYETKTFTQIWWPIQNIGPVQQANEDAALALSIGEDKQINLGLCVSSEFNGQLLLRQNGELYQRCPINLKPGESWHNNEFALTADLPSSLTAELLDTQENIILSFTPVDPEMLTQDRDQATEPPLPSAKMSNDELYLIGEHLEQYRHPTRDPEDYYKQALANDPSDYRCHTALGKRALNRGEFQLAHTHLKFATQRLTNRHPNPVDGEAHYHMGLTQRWLGNQEGAYQSLYKSTWNYAWRCPAYYQLATIDCARKDWKVALEHLEASLDTNRQNNKAHVLKAIVYKKLYQNEKAKEILADLLEVDPLDHWALHVLNGKISETCRNDAQTILDIVFDYCEAEFYEEAITLLESHHAGQIRPVAVPNPSERTAMTYYVLAWLKHITSSEDAGQSLEIARSQVSDHFFPSRLQEMSILEGLSLDDESDSSVTYALGNFYLDKRRHADAIATWEKAISSETSIPQVYRNQAIAIWNHSRDGERAAALYEKARRLDPADARLVSESDQLSAKRDIALEERLEFLEDNRELVLQRDDATVALAELYNLTGKPQAALDLILSRRFHPWEGGEGAVLKQFTNAHIALGKIALENKDADLAYKHFTSAMDTPDSLGEAYHPLQAKADVNYWIGRSLAEQGKQEEARVSYLASANEAGDFSSMEVVEHSPLSYYRGLSLIELGQEDDAKELFTSLRVFGEKQLTKTATVDYFATSLPNILVFEEDLQERHNLEAQHLINLATKETFIPA